MKEYIDFDPPSYETQRTGYIIKLEKQNQELKEILRVAQCPMCDGSGAYIDCEEQFQCQWCDERDKLLNKQ